MSFKYDGREVDIDRVSGDGDIIDIEGVYWSDTGEEITDNDLIDAIIEYNHAELYQWWIEDQVEKAEQWFDLMNDR